MKLKYTKTEGRCIDCIFHDLETVIPCSELFKCDGINIFVWTTIKDEQNNSEIILESE